MDSIEQVIRDGAVRSVFQPIVDLDSGAVVAYEALARGPRGPLQSPDALFAAARQAGVLAELDQECRSAAFRGAVEHGLLAPLTVFVNVEPEVLDTAPVEELLALATGAPGLRVVLEITERALGARPAELLRTVERVRGLGWGVALDDVGAETASLAFMPLLRPDVVKLDLSLVQRRPSPDIAEIMNAVNDYAEGTGAQILAEGIETERHLRTARALGAQLGQGWLFARPAAGPARGFPVGRLRLPEPAASGPDGAPSPFACLPAGTTLRRSPKRLLVELSKQLERQAARLGATCVVASTFQEARHFTPATSLRYRDLAARTGFVCAIGDDLPVEPAPGVRGAALRADDPVRGEWDVVVVGPHFSAALLARDLGDEGPDMDREFEYALTYRRDVVLDAARSLISRVVPAVGGSDVPEGPDRPPTSVPVATSAPAAASATHVFTEGAEPLLQRALAASTTGITIVDMARPDEPLVYVNRAFETLTGFRADELLGRNCRFLQGPDTDVDAVARLRAALREGREVRETLLNHRGPERTEWWNELHMAPVTDARGVVVQYIGIQTDVTARVEAERALRHERERNRRHLARIEELAYTDHLTGLVNRRRFEDEVERHLWEARGSDRALALLFLDLDGFKSVNDEHGHGAGDQLLVQVADRLRRRLRHSDLVARLGGDEFLVCLPGLDPRNAREEADRVAAALREAVAVPYDIAHQLVGLTVSVGVSTFPDDDHDDFRALLHHADERMYAAKHGT